VLFRDRSLSTFIWPDTTVDGDLAKHPRFEHCRATRSNDRHHTSNSPSSATLSSTTLDRDGNELSQASRGHHESSSSNATRAFQSNPRDKDDKGDRVGPSTAFAYSRLESIESEISGSPTLPASQVPLTREEKAQEIATNLAWVIINGDDVVERVDADLDFVKAIGSEICDEIADMLKDDAEWTVQSTKRRAARFQPLLQKFSKSWETDLPASLGEREEATKRVELIEAMLSEVKERLRGNTNGAARLSNFASGK
jgi:hypothetical protein